MKNQKVVITLTDPDTEGGNVKCEIDFLPPMKTAVIISPAAKMALEMVSYVAETYGATKPKVQS